MRYKDRDDMVKGLRDLADLIEEKGLELPIPSSYYPTTFGFHLYESDRIPPKENLKRVAKVLGKAEKKYVFDDFRLTKDFGKYVRLSFATARDQICQKVVTGTKLVPKREVIEIPNQFETEEIVEWVCDEPLLKA
jgi:hypothetical protein